MKILFYVEPVVFRDNPDFLLPHLDWIRPLIQVNQGDDLSYGFASSRALCARFRTLLPDTANIACFELDQWRILAPFGFKRERYSRALYARDVAADGHAANPAMTPLLDDLRSINRSFSPDVVLCSSQNAAVEAVFGDRLCLFYEQAPLPRIRGKYKMFVDPCGHQVNGLLNTRLAEILASPLSPETRRETLAIWAELTGAPDFARDKALALQAFVQTVKKGRKVAVLAMKPPDWLSYEGAFEPIRPDALLAKWASLLPDDWLGIPSFHPTSRFPVGLEQSIRDAFPNIEFLPELLSQDITELMLPFVDGLITISSNVAMAACLQGIPAIVTGECAFSALLGGRIEELNQIEPRPDSERASLIAFLTHHYCHEGERFFEERNYLLSLVEGMRASKSPESGILDLTRWSPPAIRRFL